MTTETGKRLRQRLEALLEGRYKIEKELGRGGMAIVYLARDLRHDRWVAIKLIHPEMATATLAERFFREIQITAKLQHPHILPLLDSGAEGDLLYYVMPHVEGESLRERLDDEATLPIDEAVSITQQLGTALQYAHDNGVIHRDIKPENVLLSTGLAVLADFGIAKAVADTPEGMTVAGFTLGTPAYMSPEQATGGDIDHQADQYSLACVLFEMLAGQPPFVADTVPATIELKLTTRTPPVSSFRSELPRELDQVLDRALSRRPGDRYPAIAEFAQAVDAALPARDTAVTSDPAMAVRRSSPIRIRSWGVGLLLVGGLLALGVIIVLQFLPPRAARVPDTAGARPDSAAADSGGRVVPELTGDSIGIGPILAAPLDHDDTDQVTTAVAAGFVEELRRRVDPAIRLLPSRDRGAAGPETAVALHGAISRNGEDVAVTLRLVRQSDQAILWTEAYVFPPGDPAVIRAAAIDKAARGLSARVGAAP